MPRPRTRKKKTRVINNQNVEWADLVQDLLSNGNIAYEHVRKF